MSSHPESKPTKARRNFVAGGAASLGLALATKYALAADPTSDPTPPATQSDSRASTNALVFDVFGTVVDWRSSIVREGQRLGKRKGIDVDWVAFADAWRGGYQPAMQRVRSGQIAWTNIDGLNRLILNDLLVQFNIMGLSEEEIVHFNRAWHRLWPWPDSVGGLHRLSVGYIVSTLSNGNLSLLTNMAKYAGLPWDCILSAELFGHYKPDPEVYLGAARLLGPAPAQVMMVAAHVDDLKAAKKVGLKTALVTRPLEYGPQRKADTAQDGAGIADVIATDFMDLATQLGV
jgi:2-haloacid dehalogenase